MPALKTEALLREFFYNVPLQDIVRLVEVGRYQAKPAAVFSFEQIREAQALMESNTANGKIVVKM